MNIYEHGCKSRCRFHDYGWKVDEKVFILSVKVRMQKINWVCMKNNVLKMSNVCAIISMIETKQFYISLAI